MASWVRRLVRCVCTLQPSNGLHGRGCEGVPHACPCVGQRIPHQPGWLRRCALCGLMGGDAAACSWILEADVEAALEMFLELRPPLRPSTVLPLLASQASVGPGPAPLWHAQWPCALLCRLLIGLLVRQGLVVMTSRL